MQFDVTQVSYILQIQYQEMASTDRSMAISLFPLLFRCSKSTVNNKFIHLIQQ